MLLLEHVALRGLGSGPLVCPELGLALSGMDWRHRDCAWEDEGEDDDSVIGA